MIRPVLDEGKAPAVPAAVCLVSGIFLGAWSVAGSRGALALVGVCGLSMAVLHRRHRGTPAWLLAFAAFWLGIGFAIGRGRIAIPADQARKSFARAQPGESAAVVEGVLADFWSGQPPRARTTLRAERLAGPRGWLPFPAEVVIFVSGETPVRPVADRGDRVRVTGRLEPEDLPASDREIPMPWPRYRISVKSARLIDRVGPTVVSALTSPNRLLSQALARGHPSDEDFERNVRGPLAALLLGRTAELDRGMVASFRRGGLYHLLVVSGLHVLLAAGLCVFALSLLRIEGKRRDAILLLAVFLFVLVGGANPPAVRAGLVVALFLATRLLERPITAGQAIGLSACILFLAAPAQIFSVGTVLTFAAVCGIARFARPIGSLLPSWPRWLFSGIAAALAAECATAPVLLWRFNLVAAGAWLTAPITIPLSGVLIGLGALLLLCSALGLPAALPEKMFAFGVRGFEWMAEQSGGLSFLRPTPPLWAVLAVGALLCVAALAPRPPARTAALLGAGVFLALALRAGPQGPSRGFSIEALDVGQGDAILLRWKRRAILVDGGGPFDLVSTDFGRTRLTPKLLDRGVTRLDVVLLTHPHPDHALGLFAVIQDLPVALLARSTGDDDGGLYARLEELAARRGVPVRQLSDLEVLLLDGARLTVLHSGGRRRKTDAINNQSVVALFERDGRTALLTGDAGKSTEAELAESGALTPVDVLKVGHHGSRTATSAALVAALRPRVALVSCGRRNRFGHPAPETLATLSSFCVPLLRTDWLSDCRIDLSEPLRTRLSWRGTAGP